jgi:hypothetical protein
METHAPHNCTAECAVTALLAAPRGEERPLVSWIDAQNISRGISIRFTPVAVPTDPRSPFTCESFVTVLSLACDTAADAALLTLTSGLLLGDGCDVLLEARSPLICHPFFVRTENAHKHLSGGAVFGVVLVVLLSVYLGGGAVYMRLTTGKFALPHASLWRRLTPGTKAYEAI